MLPAGLTLTDTGWQYSNPQAGQVMSSSVSMVFGMLFSLSADGKGIVRVLTPGGGTKGKVASGTGLGSRDSGLFNAELSARCPMQLW